MGIAPWPWKMENTVVDPARHFCGQPLHLCVILSCLNFFQPSLTMRLLLLGVVGVRFTYFLIFCFYFVSPFLGHPLSLKGHLFLLIIFRSFNHEKEQEGIHSTMHFQVLKLISGSCSFSTLVEPISLFPHMHGAQVLADGN